MPIPQKLFNLALQLQAFHGWEIKVLYVGRKGPDGAGLWRVRIPATGAEFAGGFQPAIAWLGGYQAGYLGGRRYTGEESEALLDEAESFIKDPFAKRDQFGRSWDLPPEERCMICGQPDSLGDCNHEQLSESDVQSLGGVS